MRDLLCGSNLSRAASASSAASTGLQGVETLLPHRLLGGYPGSSVIERGRVKGEDVLPTDDPAPHQSRPLQDTDVLGDGVQGHGERRGNLGDTRIPLGQAAHDGAPGGIGKGQERGVELLGISSSFNLLVEYISTCSVVEIGRKSPGYHAGPET